MTNRSSNAPVEPRYRIGMASRLSGVAAHNLRKWESRYGLVEPTRTAGGERVYSRADVEKLTRAGRLVEAGMDISEVARLSSAQVDELLEAFVETPVRGAFGPSVDAQSKPEIPSSGDALVVVGDALSLLMQQIARKHGSLRVITQFARPEDVPEDMKTSVPILLLLEQTGLDRQTNDLVRRLMSQTGARGAVVFYSFASREAIGSLSQNDIAVVPLLLDTHLLERELLMACSALSPLGAGPRAPRFSKRTLAQVVNSSSAIACECPRHIAQLLMTVQAFEGYSSQCETNQPEDAALHRRLRETAAFARSLFEDALVEVARIEGLDLGAAEFLPDLGTQPPSP
ncbi:MAG: DNA-binding transcriptional MerR regulator [Gammaproteobacteria bacterium]|jgi:DNA-binding transcriptional MerR regulator